MASHAATIAEPGVIPAGIYEIDSAHTSLQFVARHLMVAKVKGRFREFSGRITVDDDVRNSTAELTISAASIDTQEPYRDEHMRSGDFLDAERFPNITFKSTRVDPSGAIEGELTIRDVTRPVTLDVEFNGATVDPYGNDRIVASASTTINREDWGLTWNQPLTNGGVLVGKDVGIEIEVEAIRK
jgi:polyisoprenoid-binding protein YceI